jgi:hypothetical protein
MVDDAAGRDLILVNISAGSTAQSARMA